MERRRRLAVTAVAFATAYYAIALFFVSDSDAFTAVAAVGGAVACFAAAGGATWAARHTRRTSRRGWTAVAAGLALWAAGNTSSFLWYLSGIDQYSRTTDAIYLTAIPILLFGLTSLLAAQLPAVSLRLVLDGVIIAGSLFLVSWGMVLGPIAAEQQSPINWAISIAYPVTDVMMATVVLLVLSAGAPGTRTPLSLLSAGFLLTAVGDVAYALFDHLGNYSSNGAVNLVWFFSYMLMLLGGVWVATDPRTEPQQVTVPPYTLLPYIPFSLSIFTAQAVYFATGGIGPVLVVGCSALVMLVLGRQLTMVRENVTLNARLATTVAKLRRREEELRHRAFHDGLTELPNRVLFHQRVEEAIAAHDDEVTVLYVDLDGFKAVNDQHGHDVGDTLLTKVADRLRECLDDHLVARLGGDEFGVLLPGTTSPSVSTELAERIVSTIAGITTVDGHRVRVGASVGIAVNQTDGGVGELLRAADLAMYAAKVEGKGRYALVGSAITAAAATSPPAARDDHARPEPSEDGSPDQAAASSAAPNETWKRAHQIETLVSVSKSASAGIE
ncbi:GGDEF domain-containing protein [Cryptosporangium arvum]|uniref:Diguanylate cyclase (GGDEF) domain-containing protein n=1 Tax=Cryptosporangium arvum DSM 44712 TaxID=927661 RepID=A0A010ZSN6_9ACTN|nr:GGDEF domain-containing protein [Cryptosporangium arvum]EXG80232.1 diguanylate cyclase (GGDEF) domain-containing protein [Cryptosporangium arvum DSM 44712]